jgi:hypothetical protein
MSDSFLSSYLHYTNDSEVPVSFHRWAAIAGIGAILERSLFIPHGHSHIYPNQYCMLIGTAGTRKSTAIKLMKSMLIKAGYTTISAERTSKEKFLMDLAGVDDAPMGNGDDILDKNLFGDLNAESEIRPMFIGADEANDFFGIGNLEFLSILGSLWDWSGPPYSNRIKTGKSIAIPNPTISILAGNTPTGFSLAFPPDILGQGFFSRLLLVYGEPNGKQITFPKTPDPHETTHIVTSLQRIKSYHQGELGYTDVAKALLEVIYKSTKPIGDLRFDSYFNRRFTHLLKLCIIVAASRTKKVIDEVVVVEANTYLSYIETLMPKALGEFGKSRNSDVTHKILTYIEAHDGVKLKDLMKLVSADLEKPSDIGDIIRKLSMSDKIQNVGGIFLPMRKIGLTDTTGMIDLSHLTQEELAVKG